MQKLSRLQLSLFLCLCIVVGTVFWFRPTSQGAVLRFDAEQAVFAPTDHRIALLTTRGVQIWNDATQELTTLTRDICGAGVPGGPLVPLAWHPSGTSLALPNDQLQIEVWDVARRERLVRLAGATSLPLHLAFSPDGTLLAMIDNDQHLLVWRWRDQQLLWQTFKNTTTLLVFTTAGDQIITSNQVFRTRDGSTVLDYSHLPRSLAAEMHHGLVAAEDGAGAVSIIDFKQHTLQQTIQALDGPSNAITLSPEGRRIAVGAGRFEFRPIASTAIAVVDLQTRQIVWRLPYGQTTNVYAVHIRPDGRQLLAVVEETFFGFSPRSAVAVWDLPVP